METQRRILLISNDLMVLQTRKLMLGAYFAVSAAGRVPEARGILAGQTFDLIILCYTLSDEDCRKIIDAARVHSPDAKILKLTVTGYAANDVADSFSLAAEEGPFILVKKSAALLGFEFRSKGRMVPIMETRWPGESGNATAP